MAIIISSILLIVLGEVLKMNELTLNRKFCKLKMQSIETHAAHSRLTFAQTTPKNTE